MGSVNFFFCSVYNKLCSRWQQLTEMRENGSLDDENTDTQVLS